MRPKGKPLSQEIATKLKVLALGSANYTFPSGWVQQSFKFQPQCTKSLGNKSVGCPFGIVQNKGGPCGILAVVQSYLIKVSITVCSFVP